tara:strand:+ start:1190 stop:2245 length:1056 start_codon:yes stop_codon:yes gene_type:complete
MKKLLGIIFLSLLLSGNASSNSGKYICLKSQNSNSSNFWIGPSGFATTEINDCEYVIYKNSNKSSYNKLLNFYNNAPSSGTVKIIHRTKIVSLTKKDNLFTNINGNLVSNSLQINSSSTVKTIDSSVNNDQKNTQTKTKSYVKTFRKLDTIYKDNDKIYVVLDYWGTKAIGIANNHCSSMGKRTFWTDEYRSRYKKHFKDKGYKIKGSVAEFLCSKTKLNRATNNSLTPGFKVTEVSDEQPNNQTASSSQQVDINFNISEKRQQCEAIGFTPNSEKFADCVLRLVELDMKNQQSNNMMTSQKKSQSDQFMSNALLNLGQQLMQPNSRVNNSRTRNCSVRKSFGNTSTVTCY